MRGSRADEIFACADGRLPNMTYRPAQDLLPEANDSAEMDLHRQCCLNEADKTVCVYLPSGGTAEVILEKPGMVTSLISGGMTARREILYISTEKKRKMRRR